MKVYKVRHKPTGLFYQSPVDDYYCDSELCKRGEIYYNTNELPYRLHENGVLISKSLIEECNIKNTVVLCSGYNLYSNEEDWEIVTYSLVEKTK